MITFGRTNKFITQFELSSNEWMFGDKDSTIGEYPLFFAHYLAQAMSALDLSVV
ncbi:MAG TPA: hypothetical protein VFP87_00190 [Chitinophagaceae bacterium]|nr:hypothetical protein [Chitinophagaceae bacterium]